MSSKISCPDEKWPMVRVDDVFQIQQGKQVSKGKGAVRLIKNTKIMQLYHILPPVHYTHQQKSCLYPAVYLVFLVV